MVSFKRAIAALIVCFKPHVFLTLCILLVIAHSMVIVIQRGTSDGWRLGKQHDITLTMTTLILAVALIWAAFFLFIVRFELRNELESLLILFQCSKRGLRFLGVIAFHVGLLALVAILVSTAVERSIPGEKTYKATIDNYTMKADTNIIDSVQVENSDLIFVDTNYTQSSTTNGQITPSDRHSPVKLYNRASQSNRLLQVGYSPKVKSKTTADARVGRDYLLTAYKIWLTAIVYAFLYLVMENLIMFYTDMSLVEFIHSGFLTIVAKLTGIDLSDYPAGEMLFNPLVRHRIR